MDGQELLRIARFYAESFREIHDGPYGDVAVSLSHAVSERDDLNLTIAATLYSPVVHLQPAENFILQTYNADVFGLLMDTTYDPDLSPLQRRRAIAARLRGLGERARILQLAVLDAYLEHDIGRALAEDGSAREHCNWLEKTAAVLKETSPRQCERLLGRVHDHSSRDEE